ncbi:MAG: hypothetical protein CW691_08110 [Candidatus Bathyarchaeum sp.]|nr:MAG: hypothetical protein CW691_08110 [Candidatus Bathyarchaeum sp.]
MTNCNQGTNKEHYTSTIVNQNHSCTPLTRDSVAFLVNIDPNKKNYQSSSNRQQHKNDALLLPNKNMAVAVFVDTFKNLEKKQGDGLTRMWHKTCSFLVFLKKGCFQQCSAISLLICLLFGLFLLASVKVVCFFRFFERC